ncbi:DUF2268 domain-containing putative Zn-dependent protease [Bacillus horti]|uniref:Uncharacterized protein YjaZ n=1 Tax=Caldalkalibacillus horti TaxID=77523 RepID=A0ABT9VUW4_9BACI|nr:DUF2268 domain-containing putative Zn-dependent protease [Bacillus horti]MDQ0164781.1 uncharacterized protein YjaZ [Bacillus horti]
MLNSKSKVMIVIFSCLLLMLTGCIKELPQPENSSPELHNDTFSNKLSTESVEINPVAFSHHEQEFEIIPFYKEILEYVEQARKDRAENMELLYFDYVLEPFRRSAWGDTSSLTVNYYQVTSTKMLDKLEEYTYLLLKDQENINDSIKEALIKSADVLPAKEKKKIYLFPFHPDYDYVSELMKGIEGYAYDEEVIILSIDPYHYTNNVLRGFVASNYYNAVYSELTYRKSPTLLDSVVMSGKSHAFATIIFPDINIPLVEPLSKNEETLVWSTMADLLSRQKSTADLYFNFANGDQSVGIPYWSNHRIGYQIMQDFLKYNPDVPVEEWITMDSSDILEKSRFNERFE